jgi:hypothetical protein
MESQQVLVGAPAAAPAVAEQTQKFSLFALTMMVVGSMVGAGIFSLPRAFGTATGPFGAIIAWTIAAGGMYTLARVFQALAERKPDLDGSHRRRPSRSPASWSSCPVRSPTDRRRDWPMWTPRAPESGRFRRAPDEPS